MNSFILNFSPIRMEKWSVNSSPQVFEVSKVGVQDKSHAPDRLDPVICFP